MWDVSSKVLEATTGPLKDAVWFDPGAWIVTAHRGWETTFRDVACEGPETAP